MALAMLVGSSKLLVVATGQTSGLQASTGITVNAPTPTLTTVPTMAKPGETVVITGTHFQAGEMVNLDLVALTTSVRVGSAQANASGVFTAAVLPIRSKAFGEAWPDQYR